MNLLVKKIVIVEDGISLQLRLSGLQSLVREVGHEADDLLNLDQKYLTIHIPVAFKNRGGKKWFVTPAAGTDWVTAKPNRDPDLVRGLVLGHKWWRMLVDGVVGSINEIAVLEKVSRPLVQRRIDMTLLAPDIMDAIMEGRQPQGFSMTSFRNAIPLLWEEQQRVFGFSDNAV